jgi:tetratricopeptide (TPR) repeat protein/nitrate/TMAO reductase-like tetraheme cytochrome c subunit
VSRSCRVLRNAGLFAFFMAAVGALWRAPAQTRLHSSDSSSPIGYRLPFGPNPYLPSQAEAQFSGFLQPSDFPSAEYCGACHQAIYRQWRQSVHANSFRAPYYKKNVELLISEKGIEFTRHCEGCHNPIALFTGSLTTSSTVKRDFDEDGVTCTGCHSIVRLKPETGVGSYVMGKPAVLVDDDGKPVPGLPTASVILSHPAWHKRAMMREFYRTPEFCGACHKANLPRELNGYKWLRAFSTYDEWQQSSWARQSPAPFYKKPEVSTCQTCHMPRVKEPGDEMAAAPDGTVFSHRWLGANTAIPAYYGYDEQLRQVIDFLRSDKLKIDIFALEQGDPSPESPAPMNPRRSIGLPLLLPAQAIAAPAHLARIANPQDFLSRIVAPIEESDFNLIPGKPVTFSVVITNTGIGHSLVPEQRDFYESWVEFLVSDPSGRVVFHSGGIEPDGGVDPDAHTYTNRIISRHDDFLDKHQVWSAIVRAYDNTILPGSSDLARYRFTVPSNSTELLISVKVNYRRFRREFSDWVFGDSPSSPQRYPTVVMAEKDLRLNVGYNRAQTSVAPAPLRWNNFGIALVNEQQYGAATEVFEREAALNPTQPDGWLNAGVARYMDGDYDGALQFLAKAERIDPGIPRTEWYEGLCYRWQFRYDAAVEKLAPIAEEYPRFGQVHDALGYIDAVRHNYASARKELEAAQSIDPDDLIAHRWLATVYLKLGMNAAAEREAELTSLEKEDPVAGWEVQRFWQKHPAIAREILPYHVHTDNPADVERQAQRVNDVQNAPTRLWFMQ